MNLHLFLVELVIIQYHDFISWISNRNLLSKKVLDKDNLSLNFTWFVLD